MVEGTGLKVLEITVPCGGNEDKQTTQQQSEGLPGVLGGPDASVNTAGKDILPRVTIRLRPAAAR